MFEKQIFRRFVASNTQFLIILDYWCIMTETLIFIRVDSFATKIATVILAMCFNCACYKNAYSNPYDSPYSSK